jgi:hypothetical protein
MAHKGLPLRVERGDFTAVQGQALMLALVEGAALFAQGLVLLLHGGIGHERFHPPANALKLRLLRDGLAQFQSFPAHRVFNLDIGLHKFAYMSHQTFFSASPNANDGQMLDLEFYVEKTRASVTLSST